MNFRISVPLLKLAMLSLSIAGAQLALAQDVTIDNFKTGHYQSPGYKTGLVHNSVQTGSMMGGSRDTNMSVCDTAKQGNCARANPYNQASSYGFFPARGGQAAAMVQTGGYFAAPRIDMGYGYETPMDVDFSSYQKIRIDFNGLSQPLNFNIQLFTGTAYAQGGCNIPAYAGAFSAELPLSLFVQTQGFDFHHVNEINVIFQSGSVIGDVGFGVTSLELSNTTKGGVVIDCHY
jgi:hypothetical protein